MRSSERREGGKIGKTTTLHGSEKILEWSTPPEEKEEEKKTKKMKKFLSSFVLYRFGHYSQSEFHLLYISVFVEDFITYSELPFPLSLWQLFNVLSIIFPYSFNLSFRPSSSRRINSHLCLSLIHSLTRSFLHSFLYYSFDVDSFIRSFVCGQ